MVEIRDGGDSHMVEIHWRFVTVEIRKRGDSSIVEIPGVGGSGPVPQKRNIRKEFYWLSHTLGKSLARKEMTILSVKNEC